MDNQLENIFDERESRLIQNSIDYSNGDPAGLPGHNLMIIIAKMATFAQEQESREESVGLAQRNIDAAMEHLAHIFGYMRQKGLLDTEYNPTTEEREERRLIHSAKAVSSYLHQARNGLMESWGDTEGQLCPYEDCAHDLAIEYEGWCRCGHCRRPFFARATDGDFEDYHCRPPKDDEEVPSKLLWCRDLGTSWASPKVNHDQTNHFRLT